MRTWLLICVGAGIALLVACKSTPSTAGPGPKPKPATTELTTAVDKARQHFQDLNATDIALTAKLIEQQNLLLSLPQDSPPTREITRQLAILAKRDQTLAPEVYGAKRALEQAIEAEKNGALNTDTNSIPTTVATNSIPTTVATNSIPTTVATNSIPTTVATNMPSAPVAERGALKLRSFKLDSSSGAGAKFVIGELENSGSTAADNVTVLFELFDAAGGSLGTVSDFRTRLAPGAKWPYKALAQDNAVRVEFMDMNSGVPTGLPALPGTEPPPIPVPPPTTPPLP